MNKDSPYIKHSRLGLILFVAGLIGVIVTAMASDSGMLTIYQVWELNMAGILAMGVGGVLADKQVPEKTPERQGILGREILNILNMKGRNQ